ncbi:4-hydroxy-tetrahydrodipicolinate reductase [Calorimonas adulescens]|jgi:dihydrodipicolinate reductase (EC 1.3.1.26)|uniref:4-hydroxy-tetrahydrodipicolinate reductase n=1 Tax=Calorimonas adulescens TaxID=2606906 RepID=A0A5D8QE08_9THEO|nr:4-hydroxy-tetrahydrodipicolinate reductase [Calorimonas adulescens]TZE81753.1 4-hydroxy-tetrahydrodipicolinate reductase [Calorimonas adulescens]
MLKIIIQGISGKMGKTLYRIISEGKEHKVVAGISRSNAMLDIPIYHNLNEVKEKADVCIDFSNHSAVTGLLESAVKKKLPLVICTTGFTDDEMAAINDASKIIPVFQSFNTSIGVAATESLVSLAARLLRNFDVEIVEAHHNQKMDSPSGTAIMLARAIRDNTPEKNILKYGRYGHESREKNEIGIHSIRGGSIIGEHTVIFAGEGEMIEIKHTSLSRDIFAIGAIRAAEFIVNKVPGLYSMKDLLEEA